MADIQQVIDALKLAASRKKVSRRVKDAIDDVASSTVLLKSSTLSTKAATEILAPKFRQLLAPVYTSLSVAALRFSAAIFTVIADKIIKLGNEETGHRSPLEVVQSAILSGVLDYLDDQNDNRSRKCIGDAFYPILCRSFFPTQLAILKGIGTHLRDTVYTLLHETALGHQENQTKLRNASLLGGKRFGAVVYQTRDFLALDSLLTLLARLLPTIQNGREKRSEFIRDVFMQPDIVYGLELTQILEHIESEDWNDTAARLLDVLAEHDISCPQPFCLDEITACGSVFPQPAFCDRIYVDTGGFCANVSEENQSYETLKITYASVTSIDMNQGIAGTDVKMKLSSPAWVGQALIDMQGKLEAAFLIKTEDTKRFKTALGVRGLSDRLTYGPGKRSKISLPQSAVGMIGNHAAETNSKQMAAQAKHKYGLDQPSDPYDALENVNEAPPAKSAPFIAISSSATTLNPSTLGLKKTADTPVIQTKSQIGHEKIFGKLDEDLSDLEDDAKAFDFPLTVKKGRVVDLNDVHGTIKSKKTKTKKFAKESKTGELQNNGRLKGNALILDGASSKPRTRGSEIQEKLSTAASWKPPNGVISETAPLEATNAPSTDTARATCPSVEPLSCKPSESKVLPQTNAPSPLNDVFADFLGSSMPTHAIAHDEGDEFHATTPRTTGMKTLNGNSNKLAPVVNASKRKQGILSEQDNLATRAVKRHRGQSREVSDAPSNKKEVVTRPRTQYSTTARAPSPLPSATTRIDYDEVPATTSTTELSILASTTPRATRAKKGNTQEMEPSKTNRRTRASERKKVVEPKVPPVSEIRTPKAPKRSHKAKISKNAKANEISLNELTEETETALSRLEEHKPDELKLQTRNRESAPSISTSDQHRDARNARPNATFISSTKAKKALWEAADFNISNVHGAATEENASTADIIQSSSDEDIVMEYYVQTKFDASSDGPAGTSTPKKDTITIDLTNDSPLTTTQPANLAEHDEIYHAVLEDTDNQLINVQASSEPSEILDRPSAPLPRAPSHHPRYNSNKNNGNPVTPITPAVDYVSDFALHPIAPTVLASDVDSRGRVISGDNIEHHTSASESRSRSRHVAFASPTDHSQSKDQEPRMFSIAPQYLPINKPEPALSAAESHRKDGYYGGDHGKKSEPERRSGDEMKDIEQVLMEIHKAMVCKLEKKFEGVKKDVRVARDRFLREAAADLHQLRNGSVSHYNALVDLQHDYADHCRKTTQGWEDFQKINELICHQIDRAVEDHDRNTLTNKLPKSIFSGPMPVFKTLLA